MIGRERRQEGAGDRKRWVAERDSRQGETGDVNRQNSHQEEYILDTNLRDSWICFDQTFVGLGLCKIIPGQVEFGN